MRRRHLPTWIALFMGGAALLLPQGGAEAQIPQAEEAQAPRVEIEDLGHHHDGAPSLWIEDCDLLVVFGSHSTGIDGKLYSEILAFVEEAPGVEGARLAWWGREGERNLCLEVAPEAADRLYDEIRGRIPEEQSDRNGPTRLERRGFAPFPPR